MGCRTQPASHTGQNSVFCFFGKESDVERLWRNGVDPPRHTEGLVRETEMRLFPLAAQRSWTWAWAGDLRNGDLGFS